MMNPDDDLENEEFDGLQSYARKGMAQELAKKLGLVADVPGVDSDEPDGDEPQGDDAQSATGDAGGDSIPPELLEQILASLTKGQ